MLLLKWPAPCLRRPCFARISCPAPRTTNALLFFVLPPCAAVILFKDWVPSSGGAYVASCLAIIALAVVVQALKALSLQTEARWEAQRHAGAWVDTSASGSPSEAGGQHAWHAWHCGAGWRFGGVACVALQGWTTRRMPCPLPPAQPQPPFSLNAATHPPAPPRPALQPTATR